MATKFEKFLEDVSKDSTLESELKAALEGVEAKDRVDATIVFANEKGYDIKKEDAYENGAELDLDELFGVAGGLQDGILCIEISQGPAKGLLCSEPGRGPQNGLLCSEPGSGPRCSEPGSGSVGGKQEVVY